MEASFYSSFLSRITISLSSPQSVENSKRESRTSEIAAQGVQIFSSAKQNDKMISKQSCKVSGNCSKGAQQVKKQILVRTARVYGILAQTCSFTLPSYLHVWKGLPSTLNPDSTLSAQKPIRNYGFTPGGKSCIPSCKRLIPAKRTVSPFPHSVPTSKPEKAYSRQSRLGPREPHPQSAHREDLPLGKGQLVKTRGCHCTAPPPVPYIKWGCYSGKSEFSPQF